MALNHARLPIPPLGHIKFTVVEFGLWAGVPLVEAQRQSEIENPQCDGDPTRTRTWDSRIKSPLLYQLSYGAMGGLRDYCMLLRSICSLLACSPREAPVSPGDDLRSLLLPQCGHRPPEHEHAL